MKFARILSRLFLISLAAGVFVILALMDGGSTQSPVPPPHERAARQNRPPWPEPDEFLTLFGEGGGLILYALIGRIIFRLRLSPPSRSEGQLLRLNVR